MLNMIKSQSGLNMGPVLSKARSLGQISFKSCSPSIEATVLLHSSRNFTIMFVWMICLSSLNMGHVRSKTTSSIYFKNLFTL